MLSGCCHEWVTLAGNNLDYNMNNKWSSGQLPIMGSDSASYIYLGDACRRQIGKVDHIELHSEDHRYK